MSHPQTMLDHALAYTRKRIKVFPCHEKSKVPATPNGFKDASDDEVTIIEWFTENPSYNIAASPENAGLCVVDVDTKNGKCGIENWNALGIKVKTRTVRTPSGGLHYYFRGSLPATAGKLGNGIDTRGRGSYVLLPPSVIDGKQYEVIDDRDPVELPAAIKEALKKSTAAPLKARPNFMLDRPVDIARAVTYLKSTTPAVEFEGSDDATIKIADDVGDLGVSPKCALDLMWEFWIPRCEGYWTWDWLAEKVASAYRSRQNDIGCHAVGDTPKAWVEYAARQVEAPAQESNNDTELMKHFQWRYPDEDENLPPPEFWDAEKTIPKGSTIVAYGEFGCMKSTLVLTDIINAAIDKGAVVVNAVGEGVHGVRTLRIPAACRERRITTRDLRGKLYVCPAVPCLTVEAENEAFVKVYRPVKPDIIVFDTLATASGSIDENSAEIGKLLTSNGAVGRIKRALGNPTVILIHHSGKDTSRGARGHSSIGGNADGLWEITCDKTARTITKKVEKIRDGEDDFRVEYKVTPPQQVPVARVIGRMIQSSMAETEDLLGMATTSLQREGINSEARAVSTPGLARLMLELEFPELRGEEGRALTEVQKQRQAAIEKQLKRAAQEQRNKFGHLVRKLGSAKNAPWMWSLPYHDGRSE